MRNRVAMYLAIAAGVLLLGAGISGASSWQAIGDLLISLLGNHQALILFLSALVSISSLGGLVVILGGVLIGANHVFTGKLLITIGTGAGVFGFLMTVVAPWVQQGGSNLALWTSAGSIGIILSIAARMIAK